MTLLIMNGFEGGDFLQRGNTHTSSITQRVASTRFGYGYCLQSSSGTLSMNLPVASAKVTVGCAINYPGMTGQAIFWPATDNGANLQTSMHLEATGAITLKTGGSTVLATSALGLVGINQWHYYELTATIADSGGRLTGYLDGVQVVDYTGDTKVSGTSPNIDQIRMAPGGAVTSWDDFYVLNNLGDPPWNAPLGDCRVQTLVPASFFNANELTCTP